MSENNEKEPTVAPGIDTHNTLEAEATEEDKENENTTEVTRLYIDRTKESETSDNA